MNTNEKDAHGLQAAQKLAGAKRGEKFLTERTESTEMGARQRKWLFNADKHGCKRMHTDCKRRKEKQTDLFAANDAHFSNINQFYQK